MVINIPGSMLALAGVGVPLGCALVAYAARGLSARIEANKATLERLHLYLVAKDAVSLAATAAPVVMAAATAKAGTLDLSAAKAIAIQQGVAAGVQLGQDVITTLTPAAPTPGTATIATQVGPGDAATVTVQPGAAATAPAAAGPVLNPDGQFVAAQPSDPSQLAPQPVATLVTPAGQPNLVITPAPGAAAATS